MPNTKRKGNLKTAKNRKKLKPKIYLGQKAGRNVKTSERYRIESKRHAKRRG